MDRNPENSFENQKTPIKPSPVKAMIAWLIETDREVRATQSIVDETHDKYQK
ncbi:hypothetical protein [Roseobacter denitrificans]|uniref:hypothetical protein n=1 Tax=Roseobacter denitrificans TaxID=2434 RepID=UPI0002D3D4B8|nr:hypothetical protein [Roseobacter denitrificans]SFF73457.1 hypothetical protein SAMN05443635_101526 [Roseobacter denitrificans OCh 114]